LDKKPKSNQGFDFDDWLFAGHVNADFSKPPIQFMILLDVECLNG
jgi:hypothetical protein